MGRDAKQSTRTDQRKANIITESPRSHQAVWHINWQRTVRALGTPGSKRKPKIKLVKMGNSKVGVDWSARQCGNGAKMGQQRVAEMGHQRVAGGPERNRYNNNNSGGAGGLEGYRQGVGGLDGNAELGQATAGCGRARVQYSAESDNIGVQVDWSVTMRNWENSGVQMGRSAQQGKPGQQRGAAGAGVQNKRNRDSSGP